MRIEDLVDEMATCLTELLAQLGRHVENPYEYTPEDIMEQDRARAAVECHKQGCEKQKPE